MFEVNPSPQSANAITSLAETNAFLAEQVMPKVYQQLQLFASDPTFLEQLKLPFGDTWDIQKAQTLATEWLTGDFSTFAPIKIVASADINGSSGAFADTTNQIYLAEDVLTGSNVNQAVSVVLEEIGHSIDPRLNSSDSIGDEGEIFANIVQGKGLSPEQIQTLKSEDDATVVILDGENVVIEMNLQSDWTVWRYADWRNNNFDWLKPDGGTIQKGNRPDSKDGIYIDWGIGSPFNASNIDSKDSIYVDWGLDTSNISNSNNSDYFAVQGIASADFEAGKTYKFTVNADNGIIVAARPKDEDFTINSFITPVDTAQNEVLWQEYNDNNPQAREYNFTPDQTGIYEVYFWSYDVTGNASVDISWEKLNFTVNTARSNIFGQARKDGEVRQIFIESVDGSAIKDVPTWIVVHGNASNSDEITIDGEINNIRNLAESLESNDPNTQVLLLDWRSAANNTGGIKGLDKSTSWIPSVADTATTLINNLGLSPWNLNFVGHSLGTYVSWEIANRMGGINRLVALDPAADVPGWYDTNNIDFSQPSDWSWAFYGSAAGSTTRANTADESFKFEFPWLGSALFFEDLEKHSEVVNAFADTIKQNQSGNAGYFTSTINLNKMGTPDERPWYIGEGFEAILSVYNSNSEWVINDEDSKIAISNDGYFKYLKGSTKVAD